MGRTGMSEMDWVLVVAYLLFSASGFLALVKYFTMPQYDDDDDGLDVSWCEVFAFAIVSLIPMMNVAANSFWLWVLRQQIKRRPLIRWPKFNLPKISFPKCPIAVRGRKRQKST